MDVNTAFLNCDIYETIYMAQLEILCGKIQKILFAKLRNSSLGWSKHLAVVFEVSSNDHLIQFLRWILLMIAYTISSMGTTHFSDFICWYILLANNDIGLLHETKSFLAKNFEIKDLGYAFFVLGIQIHLDHSRGILGLSQKGYI